MADLIKKEDVSTDNIYEYEFDYETGEFSGYWLKFKYVEVPMDTKDPFNPVQNDNAYAVYDAYLFDPESERDIVNTVDSITADYTLDYTYINKDLYDDLVEGESEILEDYSILPYVISNDTMTVNKFYIPADFNIEDWIPIDFGTLNIVLDSDQNISAELQTDTNWTGKEVYTVLIDSDNTVFDLKLKADSEDPTKLVFDDEYGDTTYDTTYLDENTTGTCELQEGDNIYDVDYSWTNLYVEPEEPVDTRYVTPRLINSEGEGDINNFDIGYQLSSNVNINSPLVYAIEFTGHAETGLSFEIATDYLMGVPFGYKLENNTETEYYNLYYIYNDPGNPSIKVYLSDGDSNTIERTYTISEDTFQDFSIEEDHTYQMSLVMDSTDVQTTGIIHVVPSLSIDGNRLTTSDVGTLDFDLSQGTQDFVDWLNDFQTHIYLFGCVWDSTSGEFSVADVPFEISNVTVYYTADGDISQLNPGQTEGTWSLDAVSVDTLNDGDNDYQLTWMSQLISGL